MQMSKLDHKLNLGVSYSQAFGSGVQATLSARVNGKALDQGGHPRHPLLETLVHHRPPLLEPSHLDIRLLNNFQDKY